MLLHMFHAQTSVYGCWRAQRGPPPDCGVSISTISPRSLKKGGGGGGAADDCGGWGGVGVGCRGHSNFTGCLLCQKQPGS